MRFKNYIEEMAMPRSLDTKKTYYHGTSSEKAAKGILNKGISPPDLTSRHGLTKPIEGKVYITTDLRYALVYALEGDIIGSDYNFSKWDIEPIGYIFIIEGKQLKDIQPDEDSVGEMVYKKQPEWLYKLAVMNLADSTMRKVMDGEYAYWAKAGKVLVKKMSDNQKLELIDMGAHIAHTGALKPKELWVFNKAEDNPKFKKDASNFFQIAKRTNRI